MGKKMWFLTLIALFLTSFVSSEIVLNQPDEIYNLGDKLYVSASGIQGVGEGNLNLNLICGNTTINLERMSARRYDSGEEYPYDLPYKILNKEDLELVDLSLILGTCQVVLSVGDQSASTSPFEISKKISVNLGLDKESYNPGHAITLTVDAVKANGDLLEGFVESGNITTFSKAISEGHTTETFSTPETLESGTYGLTVSAYDQDSSGVLNSGSSTIYFEINAVPSSLVVSVSSEEIIPGEDFTLGAEVYDQSGKEVSGNVDLKLAAPDGEVFETSVESGKFVDKSLATNSTPGLWKILASYGELLVERDVRIQELQKANFDFQDSVLIVRNVGNVRYNKTINLEIGEESKELILNIGVSEERKFNIQAPSGEYEIVVGDDSESVTSSVLLTGRSISIEDISSNVFGDYIFVWIFLIAILGSASVLMIRKSSKDVSVEVEDKKKEGIFSRISNWFRGLYHKKVKSNVSNSLNFTNKSPSSHSLDEKVYEEDNKMISGSTIKKTVKEAESTLVLKGDKINSSVISVHMKDWESMSGAAKDTLIELLSESAKKNKGVVEFREEYAFVVFSPLITKTYNNEPLAVRTAFEISNSLKNHNRKYNNKIGFSIGVHSGELISSKEGSRLKYTTVGNTISFAKRLSLAGESRVLVSEEIRKKMLRDLEVKPVGDISGKKAYEVFQIKNREANQVKLKELLKRMDSKA